MPGYLPKPDSWRELHSRSGQCLLLTAGRSGQKTNTGSRGKTDGSAEISCF